jgi:hypothetical protein
VKTGDSDELDQGCRYRFTKMTTAGHPASGSRDQG